MDVRDVERDESDRHEDDADEEDDEDGEVFGVRESERPVPVEEILSEEYIRTGNEREHGDEDTDVSRGLQWEETEGNKAVKGESGEFPDAVAGGAVETLICLEGDKGSLESEPVDESPGEAFGLTETIEFFDDYSVEKSKIRRIGGNMRVADFVDDPVEEFSSGDFYPGITFARFADADDDFGSRFPFTHEIRDEFGWMLEVRIEHHAGVPRAEIDASSRRDFFAEISREVDVFDATIERDDFLYFVVGMVLTSIIDEDEFVSVFVPERRKNRPYFVIERADIFFFVVGGDDDGEGFHRVSVSWLLLFLKGSGVYEGSDEHDGEDDKEDCDGTDVEVFEEPGFVLRDPLIELMEILPPMIIAIDGAK